MKIRYTISFPNPQTHYAQVDVVLDEINQEEILLKLPVWTPGSYLIREFAKNIDALIDLTTQQRIPKLNKNTWRITTRGRKQILLTYAIYGFEWSVRTNHITNEHAFINCAATFLFVDGYEHHDYSIAIQLPSSWNQISTNLYSTPEPSIFIAHSIHELYDGVIELGNQTTHNFIIDDIPYQLALFGYSTIDIATVQTDLIKIVREQVRIFGIHPCSNYLFIIHHSESGFGGLEHENCSVNHIPRNHYLDSKKYTQAISLLSHEHFHLWNVKRIKPKELLPYNYEQENYTELLWFFEGITSYYDDLTCFAAGVFSLEQYKIILEELLDHVLNQAGIATQTLAESSFDTWIKFYRPNENTTNSQISYYKKGAVVAWLIDALIITKSAAKYNLDDAMKIWFNDTQSNNYTGLSKERILEVMHQLTSYNFNEFYTQTIETTSDLPLKESFAEIGITLVETIDEQPNLGVKIQQQGNNYVVKELDKRYATYYAGLSVNDVIVSINEEQFSGDFNTHITTKSIGEQLLLKIIRDGMTYEITLELTANKQKKHQLLIDAKSNLCAKWLRMK